jgi:nucleotide-binding universal stress UspA family protein
MGFSKKILVPVDFTKVSDIAIEHALLMGKTILADIHLIHIVENKKQVADARLKIDSLKDRVRVENGVEIHTHVRIGNIFEDIDKAATEMDASLIIMGTHGASGAERIIGSNASRVISYSSTPVIVVKTSKNPNAYRNIIFPLDLSSESKQKVKWAIHLGKSYQSTIHILTYKVGDEFLNNKLMANLKQIQNLLDENGIKHSETILEDSNDFARKTLEFAEVKLADLIMIMTRTCIIDFDIIPFLL